MYFTKKDKYKYRVIEVADNLHSLCTGSLDWYDVLNHKELAN
jgi:hypothetical protein